MNCIAYKDGYKYQLKENYTLTIGIKPKETIEIEYINLDTFGLLTIKEGYAWDGPSGLTIDTVSFMRGSLVHDALYQLMRGGYLEAEPYRDVADRLLQAICKEDGMWSIRAWWVYQGVRWFAQVAVNPSRERPILYAPKECKA